MTKKKIAVLGLAALMCFGVSACSSSEETEKTEEKEKTYKINDEVVLDNQKFKVLGVTPNDGSGFMKPAEGKQYAVVEVSIENTSKDKKLSYNTLYFSVQNSQGQIGNTTFAMLGEKDALASGELAPGGSIKGTIAFEQSIEDIEDKKLILIYKPEVLSNKEVRVNLN